MRRTVWAVTSGDYSDFAVHAIYEDKADAVAVAQRLYYEYRELPYYATGDQSLRKTQGWSATVKVDFDGTVGAASAYKVSLDVDGLGHLGRPLDLSHHHNIIFVHGEGDTEERAIKGAADRAAKVASELLDGHDPRDIVRGDNLLDAEYDADWAEAEAENSRREQQAARKAAAEAATAAARQEHQQLLSLQNETFVALHYGDTPVSDWVPYSNGIAHIPVDYQGEPRQLRLLTKTGPVPSAWTAGTLVTQVLNERGGWAHIWPTARNPNIPIKNRNFDST